MHPEAWGSARMKWVIQPKLGKEQELEGKLVMSKNEHVAERVEAADLESCQSTSTQSLDPHAWSILRLTR